VTVGSNRTKQIGQTERVSVGQHQNITVGVNRTAQVGNNDTKMVGTKHLVMITPPGEADPGASTSSSYTMVHQKIVLDTGAGATITLDKDKITIVADDLVEIWGKKRGVNLHAPGSGGSANVFTGDKFTVNCKDVSITSAVGLSLTGEDVMIRGLSTAHLRGDALLQASSGSLTKVSGDLVYINGPGQPAGRVGDAVGGTILSGSSTVMIGGAPTAVPGAKTKLGPFDSADAAAKAALDNCNPRSIAENKEYAGLIYQDPATGKFYATNPQQQGPSSGSLPTDLVPPGAKEVGMYHTHADYSDASGARTDAANDWPHSDGFSTTDMETAQSRARGNPNYTSYLGTPSGRYLDHRMGPPESIGYFN
jgi:hypothetical protein